MEVCLPFELNLTLVRRVFLRRSEILSTFSRHQVIVYSIFYPILKLSLKGILSYNGKVKKMIKHYISDRPQCFFPICFILEFTIKTFNKWLNRWRQVFFMQIFSVDDLGFQQHSK